MRVGSSPTPSTLVWLFSLLSLIDFALAYTIRRRDENPEHVVLADCVDEKGYKSSEMAYFPDTPGKVGYQDFAVVETSPGTHRTWVDSITSATFPTKVIFEANLGASVVAGEYAGSATNGYGKFSCWGGTGGQLYWHDGKTCYMVYDCDHRPKPEATKTSTSTSSATNTSSNSSTTPTNTSDPEGAGSDSNSGSADEEKAEDRGYTAIPKKGSDGIEEIITDEKQDGPRLQTGAIIGGILGIIAVIAIACIAGCLYHRRKRNSKAPTVQQHSELGSDGQVNELDPEGLVEMDTGKVMHVEVHEVPATNGRGHAVEMPADVPVRDVKIGGNPDAVELPAEMPSMQQIGYERQRRISIEKNTQ
ncbi:hypothetical protein BJ508DRAFT_327530 [Ascobolus immersus RN42]|uniref:Mid2 domain-containing protein n=1 Tax=Ascobolus immersus RN42 TaxID=1160509 RepID=A0A3N4I435_ASCIM|nr:hypothetical protein BJ508DRAFT_327530 [Ascobolus immersus RN42]